MNEREKEELLNEVIDTESRQEIDEEKYTEALLKTDSEDSKVDNILDQIEADDIELK